MGPPLDPRVRGKDRIQTADVWKGSPLRDKGHGAWSPGGEVESLLYVPTDPIVERASSTTVALHGANAARGSAQRQDGGLTVLWS